MAKDKEAAKEKLFTQLGKNDYKIGKQSQVCNKENEILRVLQIESNRIATEIEKLDG